jgi:SET domain-containing protein
MITLFPEDDRVYLDISSLPGAGKGLFARRRIHKKSYLVYWGSLDESLSPGSTYTYVTKDGVNVNARQFKNCPARWINDGGPSGVPNNCVWEESFHPLFPCIRTSRDIEQGEELLVSYGPEYWEGSRCE